MLCTHENRRKVDFFRSADFWYDVTPHSALILLRKNPGYAAGNSLRLLLLSAQLWHTGFGGISRRMYRRSQFEDVLTALMRGHSMMSVYWIKWKAFLEELSSPCSRNKRHSWKPRMANDHFERSEGSIQPGAMVLAVSTVSYIFNLTIAIMSGISTQTCLSLSSSHSGITNDKVLTVGPQ